MSFITFNDLETNAPIDVNACNAEVSDLTAVPASKLPTGVASGTYIALSTGRVLAVRGDVPTTALALVTGCPGATTASGNFTPTLTAISHASGLTLLNARYMQIGNIVVMNVEFDVTADGAGDCVTDVSLPVPSNFASSNDGSGVAVATPLTGANVQASSATHKARVPLVAAPANTYNIHLEFMYTVLP